jgi:phenylacetate-CoA ligase
LQPDFLQGYPSVLRLLALHIVANGLPVPALKKIFTDSELLTSNTRALLMRVFKTDVVDVFGSYETDNIAYECSAHRGYHIAEDSVIVELSDQDVSEDADGTGNLVCTVLHNAVTPFIRYDLGDLVGISTEPCECGRTTRTLSVLKGRANDLITRPDGTQRNAMVLIDFCTNSFLGTATEFQIRQRNAYEFEISVVWDRSGEPVDSVEFDRAFAAAFSPAKATIRAVDKIRRTPTGKYTLFIGLDQPERDAE